LIMDKLKPKPVLAIASQVFPPVTGTGAVTEQIAIDAAKNKEVIATATVETESLPEQKPETVTLTAEQLQNALQAAIASAKQEATQEADRKRQEIQAQLNETKNQLATAQNQATAITNVLTTLGHTHPVTDVAHPAVNRLIESGNDRITGRLKEWRDRIDKAFSQNVQNPTSGIVYQQKDWRSADRYFIDNRAALRDEVEQYCKANGFFKELLTDKAAATVRADLLPTLLDFLSASIRKTQSAKYIFWQFAFKDIKIGKATGDTVQVSRVRDLTAPTSVTDTLLAITGPGATRSNLSINSVSGVLQRRGLNEPVQIPQFFTLYSLLDLEMLVGQKLGKHHQADVDLRIRTRFLATTKVLYNNGADVTATPGDVGTGDDGTLTESFLNAAHAYITGTYYVDTDDMGALWLAAPARALAPLKNSLANNNRYMDQISTEKLTALFTMATNSDVPTISGYVGTFCGFHIFQSTAYGNGAAGTEGVQNETLGVGSTLTRSVIAGGYYAVARAVGMEAEIRRATEDNFQTQDAWTWISDEVVFDLDVDSAIAAEQQDRIFELRVTDSPV
jgi:uncharacterized protein YeaC (DUF1315 family)